MQLKLCSDTYLIQGTSTKDAEFSIKGNKDTHITTFSLVVGKNKDTTTIFANCKAFNRLADYAKSIKKGDSVLCIGKIESREWQGKEYKDLICDWLNAAAVSEAVISDMFMAQSGAAAQIVNELGEAEDDLPF